MTWLADFFGAQYVRAIAAAVVVALIAWLGWQVSEWRSAYVDLQAVEDRLRATEEALATRTAEAEACSDRERIAQQAWAEAAGKAAAQAAADRATAERVERELQDKLAAADGRARDLARRLLDATRAGAGGGALSGAAVASAQPARAGGEPGSDGGIEQATAEVMRACAADATRLDGWRVWWGEVSAGR